MQVDSIGWRSVLEGVAALVLLVALIRLTGPTRARAGAGRRSVVFLTEIGVSVALAAVLGTVRIYRAPQGGSVSLVMVPILYLALRRGPGSGMLAGIVLGVVKLLLDPYVVHPLQVVMDYPLAYGVLGIAGAFPRYPTLGVLAGSLARFLVHLLSGVVFFASYAPEGSNVWAYSALYNASYMVPEAAISAILMFLLGIRAARGPRRQSERRFR